MRNFAGAFDLFFAKLIEVNNIRGMSPNMLLKAAADRPDGNIEPLPELKSANMAIPRSLSKCHSGQTPFNY